MQGIQETCPECKKPRCFTRYVDEEGIIVFPDYVGRCDHENSCGYHYTPKDYFHDNPDEKPNDWKDDTPIIYNKVEKSAKTEEQSQPVEPSLIPYKFVKKSIAGFDINPLYTYLCGVLGKDETKRIFQMYIVGTGKKWGGCTVFWQIDINGYVRAGKLMGYNSQTGHRIKDPTNQVTWAHSALKLPDFHLVQCLFGEHLLREKPTATVALVESEKTALIMTHFMPDFFLMKPTVHEILADEQLDALRKLSGMANNLNQLAYQANIGHLSDLHSTATQALYEILSLIHQLKK